MNETTPLEIEKKYVIEKPDIDALSSIDGYTKSEILQTYLLSNPKVTHRVRRRTYNGHTVYTETKKVRIDKISSFEDEREIDENEYLTLLAIADPMATPVEKTRHTVPIGELTLEIDVYPAWEKCCVMEIELPSRETEPIIPDFIHIIVDVTGDKRYSNASMSRAFPPEPVS